MVPPEEDTPTLDCIVVPRYARPRKTLASLAVKGGMRLINQ